METREMVTTRRLNLSKITKEHSVQNHVYRALLRVNGNVTHRLSSRKLVFISNQDLMRELQDWNLCDFPGDFDVVCAIPRTGFLVGTVLSERFNVPLSTPELVSNGLCWSTPDEPDGLVRKHFKHVLLVDDSAGSGQSLASAERTIKEGLGNIEVVKAVVFVSAYENAKMLRRQRKIDLFKCVFNGVDTVFEYHLHNRYGHWNIASDLDGVICENPEGNIAENLARFYRTAKPKFVPHYSFSAIISDRLEDCRVETVEWLKLHNVMYKELFLAESFKARPFHKVSVLKRLKPKFFIESEPDLAEQIWRMTNTPTLCYKTMRMYS